MPVGNPRRHLGFVLNDTNPAHQRMSLYKRSVRTSIPNALRLENRSLHTNRSVRRRTHNITMYRAAQFEHHLAEIARLREQLTTVRNNLFPYKSKFFLLQGNMKNLQNKYDTLKRRVNGNPTSPKSRDGKPKSSKSQGNILTTMNLFGESP